MELSHFHIHPPISTVPFYSTSGEIGPLTPDMLQAFHIDFHDKTLYYSLKTLPAVPVDTFYKTLIISFLIVLPLNLYANQSLVLQSGPWCVAQMLGIHEALLLLHPSKSVEYYHHSIKPLQK